MINGNFIQIHNATKINYLSEYYGHVTEQVDSNYNTLDLSDGNYLTEIENLHFILKTGKCESAKNLIKI